MYDGNPGEIDFGSSYREVRVSEGSSYRESTVVRKYTIIRTLEQFPQLLRCKENAVRMLS